MEMASWQVTNWGAVLELSSIGEDNLLIVLKRFFVDVYALFRHDRESVQCVKRIDDLLNAPMSGQSVTECFKTLVKYLEQCGDRLVVAAFANVLELTEQRVKLVYERPSGNGTSPGVVDEFRKRSNSFPLMPLGSAFVGVSLHRSNVANEYPPDPLGSRSEKIVTVNVQTELQQQSEVARSSSTQTTLTIDHNASMIAVGATVPRGNRPEVRDVGTNTSDNIDGGTLNELGVMQTGEGLVTSNEAEAARLSPRSVDVRVVGLLEGFTLSDDEAVDISHLSDADLHRVLLLDIPFGEPIEEMVDESDDLA